MTFFELAMAAKVPLFRLFSTVSMFALLLDQLKTDVIETENTVAVAGPDDYGHQLAQMVLYISENGTYNPTLFESLKELLLHHLRAECGWFVGVWFDARRVYGCVPTF